MTIDAIRDVLRNRRPFKVGVADGRTLDIPHPEFAMLSRSGRLLHAAVEGDRVELLDVLLITSLQPEIALPT